MAHLIMPNAFLLLCVSNITCVQLDWVHFNLCYIGLVSPLSCYIGLVHIYIVPGLLKSVLKLTVYFDSFIILGWVQYLNPVLYWTGSNMCTMYCFVLTLLKPVIMKCIF